jgi:hypothetical protein
MYNNAVTYYCLVYDLFTYLLFMKTEHNLEDRVVEKIKKLSNEEVAKVERFIDSLNKDNIDDRLTFVSTKIAESVFDKVWNNLEDADYDNL